MRSHIGGEGEVRRSAKPVGLIGADASALALAKRIAAAGHRVELSLPGAAGVFARMPGIELASTPTDVALDSGVVLSTIEDTDALRTLLLGSPDRLGLGAEMSPGAVFVDLGVRPARETQVLLGVLGTRGVAVIDAAIIGGDEHDGDGATVLVGGYPDAVDAAAPILSCIGRVERTGALGSAHTAAALMGYMEAAQVVAEHEAMSVGRALGLSDATLAHVVAPAARAKNVVMLAQRLAVASRIATDKGVSADVIEFTGRRLPGADGGA